MDKYSETLDYIHSLGKYSNPPHIPHRDLSKIKYLCDLFDNPQESCKTIHIAGTNGKGSAAAMLSNILQELGYKTGRYISPFIESFTERISIDGSDISKDEIVFYSGKIKKILAENKVPIEFMPNEFEFVTLMAFMYYREKSCDAAVIETGLGGRLDPTNIIKSPMASVIMSVSLDHMEILGDTVEKIAYEKCGIIKENSKVVLYPLNNKSVINIAANTAKEKNCGFILPDINSVKILKIIEENLDFTLFEYKNNIYKIKLAGRHQVYNAVTAIETINSLFKNKSGLYEAVYNGLEKTFFPSRFEILSKDPLLILDGAHNISGVNALCGTVQNLLQDKKIIFICGMVKGKQPEESLKNICFENSSRFIAVPVNSPRSESPEKLCEYASKYCKNSEYADDLYKILPKVLNEAANSQNNTAVVCFGSLYLAGDVKKAWTERDERNNRNKP